VWLIPENQYQPNNKGVLGKKKSLDWITFLNVGKSSGSISFQGSISPLQIHVMLNGAKRNEASQKHTASRDSSLRSE
jgi:hypothetical protein